MNPLMSLLCEPLALDLRAVPMLIESARLMEDEPEKDPRSLSIEPKLIHGQTGEPIAAVGDDSRTGSVIAVVPLTGVVTRHGYGRRPGTAQLSRTLKRLDADPVVGAIVLDVDSPGGSVYGTSEAATTLYNIRQRGQTKTVAVTDPLMASAATWIGTAAEKVYAIESADVGSIGVLSSYVDFSEQLKQEGIEVTIIRTPSLKARFSSYEPLTDSMRETMESRIQESYDLFLQAMSRNRGVSTSEVEKRFGGGEVMRASDGVSAGLIDGIASIEEVIEDLVSETKRQRMSGRAAAAKREVELAKANLS